MGSSTDLPVTAKLAGLEAPQAAIGAAETNVAIVGFGTVGRAVAKILCNREGQDLRLTHIANRKIERKKVDWVPCDVTWTEDFDDVVLGPDVDVVVELIGGLHPAKELVSRALAAGKSVVTANKQLIAEHGPELLALARKSGQALVFGASVCGGMPVLPALESGLGGDRVIDVQGVLNGTCNYILSRIENERVSFEEALAEAQELGYAEADPTDDVDGYDARAKLTILARIALRREVSASSIPCRTIRSIKALDFTYAKRIGCTIRQISRAKIEGDTVAAWVQPALVPLTSVPGTAQGSRNVVVTVGEFGGENVFSGLGAGGDPTAVAVVSDLLSVARSGPALKHEPVRAAAIAPDFESAYFVRLVIDDKPGQLAILASLFSKHGINIDSVLQERGFERQSLPFVITLEKCLDGALRAALTDMEGLDFLVENPLSLPILQ